MLLDRVFTGIVEAKGKILSASLDRDLVRIVVEKPSDFQDLKIGDSVAVNGICLTVERFDSTQMVFALGAETLKITGWSPAVLLSTTVNLERSLRLGDRIHGHMVSGHVDATGEVAVIEDVGGSVKLAVRTPKSLVSFVWPKGSWAVNGVSLTINLVQNDLVEMCLIPETLLRTNLGDLKPGDKVNLEIDMMARGLVHFLQTQSVIAPTASKNS